MPARICSIPPTGHLLPSEGYLRDLTVRPQTIFIAGGIGIGSCPDGERWRWFTRRSYDSLHVYPDVGLRPLPATLYGLLLKAVEEGLDDALEACNCWYSSVTGCFRIGNSAAIICPSRRPKHGRPPVLAIYGPDGVLGIPAVPREPVEPYVMYWLKIRTIYETGWEWVFSKLQEAYDRLRHLLNPVKGETYRTGVIALPILKWGRYRVPAPDIPMPECFCADLGFEPSVKPLGWVLGEAAGWVDVVVDATRLGMGDKSRGRVRIDRLVAAVVGTLLGKWAASERWFIVQADDLDVDKLLYALELELGQGGAGLGRIMRVDVRGLTVESRSGGLVIYLSGVPAPPLVARPLADQPYIEVVGGWWRATVSDVDGFREMVQRLGEVVSAVEELLTAE